MADFRLLSPPPMDRPMDDEGWQEFFHDLFIKARALAVTKIAAPPEHADNAAALAAGLVAGDLYRTADVLKVVHA